jgi:hypothetical protein
MPDHLPEYDRTTARSFIKERIERYRRAARLVDADHGQRLSGHFGDLLLLLAKSDAAHVRRTAIMYARDEIAAARDDGDAEAEAEARRVCDALLREARAAGDNI